VGPRAVVETVDKRLICEHGTVDTIFFL